MTLIPLLLGALGLAGIVYAAADVELLPRPDRGHRGAERRRARRSLAFRLLEAPTRLVAAHIERLGPGRAIERAEGRIVAAGDYLGLTGSELLALRVVGAGLGAMTAAIALGAGVAPFLCTVLVPLGGALPELSLRAAARDRASKIDRGLPNAIDLAAMCMGAGLDFPGALAQVVANLDRSCPLREELERILQELALGHTRRQALQQFATRVSTEAVREFVSSCVQAEEKGTPLVAVLRVQAGSLRGRRSVRAEEAAARAGALMIAPLMMLFCCVLLIVLGPLVLEMRGGM